MKIIKNKMLWNAAAIAALVIIKPAFAAEPVVELNYNEDNGSAHVVNSAGGSDYQVHFYTGKNTPERVPGVNGNALRTDGYSTWVTGPLNMPATNQLALSTWIALESYPSTEEGAAKDSSLMHQTADGKGFSLSINTYGEWWLRVNIAGQAVNLKAPDLFPLYHWTHVAATVNSGQLSLFINGNRVAQKQFTTGNIEFANNAPLVIGRSDNPQTSFNVFEVNAINAAYDVTRIYPSVPAETQWQTEYAAGKDTPWRESIAVPESRFADDVLRPLYHAMAPANWTNEPHGLVRFNGRYHMFYQRTPNGPFKWMMHWGHMVSDDLVHWENLKDSFYPALNTGGMSGVGSKGIWSGDVIVDGDTAYAFYTTVNFEGGFDPGIAWATSKEANLEHWQKKGGLIDKNQPNPAGINDFRDPYLWKQDNRWHMIIGAAIGSGGAVEHYTTTDLASGNWARASQPFTSLPFSSMDTGSAIWEMPVFEYIGKHDGQDKYILVVSPIGGSMRKTEAPYVRSVYWTGTWNSSAANGAGQFTPDYAQPKNLDVIHGHLSPTVTRATNGDLVAIGIVDERTNSQIQNDLGWAHTYSLPRVWKLLPDGKTLGQTPAVALQSLRELNGQKTVSNVAVNGEHKLPITSNQVEIIAEVNPAQTATSYGLVVSASPDRDEYTRIYYDGDDLVIDKSNSSNLSGLEETGTYRGAYDEVAFGKPTKFHVFIDHSVITVFINDKAVFENRIYPVRQDSQEIALYSAGGPTSFTQIVAYPLRAANDVKRPQLKITSDSVITEDAESGGELMVEAINASWAGTLSVQHWSLTGAPEGVAVGSLDRISDTHVKLTLTGNSQADYDQNIVNAQVQIAANQFASTLTQPTLSGTLPSLTAIVEPVTTLVLSAPEALVEGQEAGKSILITLTNNQFKSPLDPNHWLVENLPMGLDYDLELLEDKQTVRLTLRGKATNYHVDVVNFGVTVDPAALVNLDPELHGLPASVQTGIQFKATTGTIAYNFETGDLTGWCSSGGDAFTGLGVTDETSWWNGVFNQEGVYHFWGFNSGEDAAVGQMRSGTFVLEGIGQIHYRIAGGNDPDNLHLALVRASTDEILMKDTGTNSETYVERKFDASKFIGESLYLRAHDSATGEWGHINLDDIRVPVADHVDGVIPMLGSTVIGISLSPSSVELMPEQSVSLQAVLNPSDSCSQSLVWTSSDSGIAKVSQGVVTAVAPGTATIMVSNPNGGVSAQAQVLVKNLPPMHIYDFEDASLAGWTVTGNAFSLEDISTATTFWQGQPFNHQGTHHLWGHQDGGDGQRGELISNSFVLGGDGIIRVLLSGGNDLNNLYLALKHTDGSELMRITGNNSEAYTEQVLEASAYLGQTLRVHLVDNSVADFGHINMDNLRIPLAAGEDSSSSAQASSVASSSLSSHPVNSSSSSVAAESSSSRIFSSHVASSLTSSSLAIQVSSSSAVASSQASGLLVYDFEAGNLNGWTLEGAAFAASAISSDTHFWDGIPFNHQGTRHLWSFKAGGDQLQGRMTSDVFTLGGDGIIRVKVSGGNDINNLYVAVIRPGTNTILARVTGSNTEAYTEVSMNLSGYIGENLQVQLVDTSSGGFGHINTDDLRIPTGPALSYKIFDFETGTLAGWSAQGAAFSADDVTGDSCYWAECLSFKREGNFHLWGFKAGGDIDQGELQSDTFTLGGHGQIRALISGGNDTEKLYLALMDDQNGTELMRITGNNSEEFVEKTMNASAFVGRRCYLKAVDQAIGGWGHLNLDNIRIPLAQ